MKIKIIKIVVGIVFAAMFTYTQLALWNILQKNIELDNHLALSHLPDHSMSITTYVWVNLIVIVLFWFLIKLSYIIIKESNVRTV